MTLAFRSVAGAIVVFCACDAGSGPPSTNGEESLGDAWLTEAEFEFGEGVGGQGVAAFSPISAVRVLDHGEAILVLEPSAFRITIWTPDGILVREVGQGGQGPGEFTGPLFVEVGRDGFRTRDAQRYTSFSDDGTLVETTPYPPARLSFRGFPLRPRALLLDGSFLTIPQVPPAALAGFGGDEPIDRIPVFHVHEDGGEWRMDTVAMLDMRNRDLLIVPEGSLPHHGIQTAQFYGDYDLAWYDPEAGSVVVLRRNLGGGEVELSEINVHADTMWNRRFSPPQFRLSEDQLASFLDDTANRLAAGVMGSGEFATARALRDAMEDAVYVPDPLPGAIRMHGTASGEIWFRGYERYDTLVAWYAVSRDGTGGRKVLLPTWFRATDATDTHVWGWRRGTLGVQYVVGRRLVPTAGP